MGYLEVLIGCLKVVIGCLKVVIGCLEARKTFILIQRTTTVVVDHIKDFIQRRFVPHPLRLCPLDHGHETPQFVQCNLTYRCV